MLHYILGLLFALWVCYEIDRTRKRDGKSRVPFLGHIFENFAIYVLEENEKSRMQSIARKEHHHKKSDHEKKSDHHSKKSYQGKKKKDKNSGSIDSKHKKDGKKKGKKGYRNENNGFEKKKDGSTSPEGSADVAAIQPGASSFTPQPSNDEPKNAS